MSTTILSREPPVKRPWKPFMHVLSSAHMSYQIKKVATDTSYTYLTTLGHVIKYSYQPTSFGKHTNNYHINICSGGSTSDMRMGGDNIPQYTHTIGGGDFGMLEEAC